ncbi:MOSC domain-containing protein [Zobellia galactanivorans]|uniref:MOSC family protein n=1 Tax=Zobellia galactanivorans (strain DSM 12802 / CCUG 47099 / CIP 106680 / NCIMB 13871 / Dsij) TaxID=63186 RepID=G0L9M1_ZOBGA|nr:MULTISPECIES: MOSC domain-containing protein [Zobellia]MDO6810144.1 MOSC domain-containing protein [Zobellia galactanivorans]OWW23736.1 sulfurase [Zobellia sp. OII3]CAZ94684.1 MOSC family protein [Zobellia galactanivorans]
MEIISTNIGRPTTVIWNGKNEQTGIFKSPVEEPLFLGKTDVAKDSVIDRKHHAGINKACFLFSVDHYDYWKKLYPDLEWKWGMFGENLSVSGLDESIVRIGDIYKIGSALVQISQPREPCYKLGIRFNDQGILKKYIDYGYPGTYVRILEEGEVRKGEQFILIEQSTNELTVKDFFQLLFMRKKDPKILELALTNLALPEYKRERLKKYQAKP